MAAVAKKAAKPAARAAKPAPKSAGWKCEACGLEIEVDDWGDVGVTEFFCCEEKMKPKAAAKKKAATKAK